MSFRRRLNRRLREVHPEEAAFKQMLAVHSAFLQAGITSGQLMPGFMPVEGEERCSPMMVVTGSKKEFAYRLDDHKLDGDQAALDKKWREWVIVLINDGSIEAVAKAAWEKSAFATRQGRRKIRELLESQGMAPGGGEASP